jgi:putative protease
MPKAKKKKISGKVKKVKKCQKRVVKKRAKKVAKQVSKKKISIKKKEKLIGKVTHYFDKIKVAAIKLNSPLKLNDQIRIVGGEVDFKQKVKSMEIDHKKVKKAKKGDEIGLKVNQKVREGYRVFKL